MSQKLPNALEHELTTYKEHMKIITKIIKRDYLFLKRLDDNVDQTVADSFPTVEQHFPKQSDATVPLLIQLRVVRLLEDRLRDCGKTLTIADDE